MQKFSAASDRQRYVTKLTNISMQAFTSSFKVIDTAFPLDFCHSVQKEVFHTELGFTRMQIPDQYDAHSIYAAVTKNEEVIGTFRVILANQTLGLPIQDVWKDVMNLSPTVCEFSRLAILKNYRGRGLFRNAVECLTSIAVQNGASKIISDTLIINRKLFEKYGFKSVGEDVYDPTVDLADTGEVNCVPMIMSLK